MNLTYHLVAYDPVTNRIAFEVDLPEEMARDVANPPCDDPDMIYDYEITPEQGRNMASSLGVVLSDIPLDFVIEAYLA